MVCSPVERKTISAQSSLCLLENIFFTLSFFLWQPDEVFIFHELQSMCVPSVVSGGENDPHHLASFRHKVQLFILH